MALLIQGIGTGFVGKRDFHADGSYITTEWFMLIFPIIPLRSMRVKEEGCEGSAFYSKESYKIYEKTKLNLKQVFFVYGFNLIYILWLIFLFFNFDIFNQSIKSDIIKGFLMIFTPFIVPFILRSYARYKLKNRK